ncbi:MAG: ATP cone domain-containing protein, partial [Candidatus Bathyarchaeota archaeon]|nr:ATP cone domain-containing protein [Candidatus Bathyarchaeota archaeon]
MPEKPSKIRKRDGRIVNFDQKKITDAILKALAAVKQRNGELAKGLSDSVVKLVSERFAGKIPHVEDVQDIVEEVLVKNGYVDTAKAYILYRQKRTEIREFKTFFDVVDDLKLGINAIKVLKKRYLLKDIEGNVIETPRQMFRRVAKTIAQADRLYDKEADS